MSATTAATISLVSALSGAGLGFLSTMLTLLVAGRREDKRREHEQNIKRMELEDSRFERRRDERMAAYRKFYAAVHSTHLFSGPTPREEVTPEFRTQMLVELAGANTELELLAPAEVRRAADEMYYAAFGEPGELKAKEDAYREAVRKDLEEAPQFNGPRQT